jgi:hypothetical protein
MKKDTLTCGCIFTFSYIETNEGLMPCQGYLPCSNLPENCELNKI